LNEEVNMSKLALLAILLLAASSPLMGQTEQMTPDQLQEYNRSRLYIDLSVATTAVSRGFGAFAVESHSLWTARQGFNQLSEAVFYKIAGYPNEAKKASQYKTLGWTLLIGGGALMAGGFAWMMIGPTSADYSDPDFVSKMYTGLIGGSVMMLVGVIPLYIGRNRVRKNWSSTEQAQIAADEYNAKQAAKILSK
jgi:hypothetical protein